MSGVQISLLSCYIFIKTLSFLDIVDENMRNMKKKKILVTKLWSTGGYSAINFYTSQNIHQCCDLRYCEWSYSGDWSHLFSRHRDTAALQTVVWQSLHCRWSLQHCLQTRVNNWSSQLFTHHRKQNPQHVFHLHLDQVLMDERRMGLIGQGQMEEDFSLIAKECQLSARLLRLPLVVVVQNILKRSSDTNP